MKSVLKTSALIMGLMLMFGGFYSCKKNSTPPDPSLYFNELVKNGQFEITIRDTSFNVAVINARFDRLINDSVRVLLIKDSVQAGAGFETVFSGCKSKVWNAVLDVRNMTHTLKFKIDCNYKVNSVFGYLTFLDRR